MRFVTALFALIALTDSSPRWGQDLVAVAPHVATVE